MQPNPSIAQPGLIDGLRAELAQARAAERARLDHLAEVSHELKTPVNGILGIVSLLRATELDADQREMIGLIHDSADEQARLVADLNHAARLDAGVEPLDAAPFEPRAVAASVVGLLRPTAAAKGLALTFDTNGGDAGAVVGDSKLLRRIVANLAGNAVKFTEVGSVRVTLETARAVEGVRLRLAVTDTGPGIPSDMRARVFERFARGTTAIEGSGLGLHICKGLVEMMDGSIAVGDAPGGGCAITVDLVFPPADVGHAALEGVR